MEDKWGIAFYEPWLYLHRSWTANCVYAVRFQAEGDSWIAGEAWVNRCSEQYQGESDEYDAAMLQFLIEAFLLKKDVTFPSRNSEAGEIPSLLQHAYVGRVFRSEEAVAKSSPKPTLWQKIRAMLHK